MRLVIFDDLENSKRSLDLLNENRTTDKRFWKFHLFRQLVYDKVKELLQNRHINLKSKEIKPEESIQNRQSFLELVRTYGYSGEYTTETLNALNRSCGYTIREMTDLIKREDELLSKIRSVHKNDELRTQIENHVNYVKGVFEKTRADKLWVIQTHKNSLSKQQEIFDGLRSNSFFELRTRPLLARNGFIQQKGIDVQLATDLIQLGHTHAYDVALILSGDVDLIESINLVRLVLGRLVIICAYYDEIHPLKSTISKKLIQQSDYFINIKDFNETEIQEISEKYVPFLQLTSRTSNSNI